jgi:hypothetical protein
MDVDRRQGDARREEIETALDTAATKAAEKAARRTANRAAGGYFLLLAFLLAGAVAYQANTNAKIHAANVRLERSEIRACERLQTQRERANVSDARQYLLSVAIAQAPRASAMVRDEYAGLSRTATYDPPTDCDAAVGDPAGYVRPASVPYCATGPTRHCGASAFPTAFARELVKAAQDSRPQPVFGH